MAQDIAGFQTLPASPEVLSRFCEAIREELHVEAVQIVRRQGDQWERVSGSEPGSSQVAGNLLTTAAPYLSDDIADVQKGFQFDSRTVYLIGRRLKRGDWLLVWAALTNPRALELARQFTSLAALACPQGDSAALPESGVAEKTEEVGPWLAQQSGGSFVVLARHTFLGWRIIASGPEVPSRSGALAREVRRALADISGEASLGEIARLTGTQQAVRLSLGKDTAGIVAGPAGLRPEEVRLCLLARLASPEEQGHRRWWQLLTRRSVLVAAGILLLIALIPIPDRVRVQVLVEPSLRRTLASPFDAVLKQVNVRRGDVVKTGDVLVEIDGREAAERLAEIEAKLASARLESASDLEGSNYASSVLRSLDADSLAHELAALQHRRDHLVLRSPIDGVVVGGELERARGAAVELGHPLLEIAPLDPLVAELAVNDTEVSLIRAGEQAEIQLDAFPSRRIRVKVDRVRPRSETREGRNVFVAEAQIENARLDLRPGMRGRGVIIARSKPIIWLLVRKPWQMANIWLFR